MENENTPITQTQMQENSQSVPPATEAKSPKNPTLVLITVLVIIALGISGFFFIKQNKSSIKNQPSATSISPTTIPSPTLDPTDENAIESINVGEADQSDFEVIEADLKTL
jgi:uncharacterized protein HemX